MGETDTGRREREKNEGSTGEIPNVRRPSAIPGVGRLGLKTFIWRGWGQRPSIWPGGGNTRDRRRVRFHGKTGKETGARTGATGPEHNRETKEAASKTNKTENDKAEARGDLETKEVNRPRTNPCPRSEIRGYIHGHYCI